MNERPPTTRIAQMRAQELVTLVGVIREVTKEAIGPSPAVRCVLADPSGQIDLLFLGRESIAGLTPGRSCTVTGRAAVRRRHLVIWNPRYELEPPDAPPNALAATGTVPADRLLFIGDRRPAGHGAAHRQAQRREEGIAGR